MIPIDLINDSIDLIKATFTYERSKYPSKIKLETSLPILLYWKHLQNLVGRVLHLLGKESIVR